MNGSNVQAKKPICKCLLVATASVCVFAYSQERVCLCRSASCVALRASLWVFLLVAAAQADAVMTPHLSPHSVTFSC